MLSIFNYMDYREFLRDLYNHEKLQKSFFSYRYMGSRLKMDASYLVRVMNGKVHLGESNIPNIVEYCRFNRKEAEYFENLVKFGKAKNDKQAQKYFEKLISAKSIQSRQIEKYQYEYFKKWYYSAVRSLLGFMEFKGDFKSLGKSLSPAISPEEAKRALAILEELKFVKKTGKGGYVLSDSHISTGQNVHSLVVRNFHREIIRLAMESLERHKKEKRHFNTLTLSVDQQAFEDIKELSEEFSQAVKKRVSEVERPDRVCQLGLQIFPLSETMRQKK